MIRGQPTLLRTAQKQQIFQLAPLYAQVEELRAKYYPNEQKVEQPTPEEVEEAELEEKRKEWKKIAEEMRAKGKL